MPVSTASVRIDSPHRSAACPARIVDTCPPTLRDRRLLALFDARAVGFAPRDAGRREGGLAAGFGDVRPWPVDDRGA
jgi:hypothetical protein